MENTVQSCRMEWWYLWYKAAQGCGGGAEEQMEADSLGYICCALYQCWGTTRLRNSKKEIKKVLFRYWGKMIFSDCSWVIKTCQGSSRSRVEWEWTTEKAPALNLSESGPLLQSRWILCWDAIPLNLTGLRDLSIASMLKFRATTGFLGKVYSSFLVVRLHSQLPGAEELPNLVQRRSLNSSWVTWIHSFPFTSLIKSWRLHPLNSTWFQLFKPLGYRRFLWKYPSITSLGSS